MPQLSKKGIELPTSPIRKLVVFSEKAKTNGIEVLHLNIGQPDIAAPKEAIEAVTNSNLSLLPYGPSQGTLSYRKKLVDYYSKNEIAVENDDIVVTTGASEALIFALNVICDAGDEIIIPEPFYANYNGFASAACVRVVPVISEFHSQFQLPDLEKINEKITSKTKAILLCNPSNPTGYVYSKKEIDTLCELAIKNDIFLIVDEVYREFIYSVDTHYSVLSNEKYSEYTVMIDSVSKRYSMCGARIGYLVSKNKNVIKTALKFAQARLSPPTLAQIASEAALQTPQSYFDEVIDEYVKRRNILINELEKIEGVKVAKPNGAFYCIAELPIKNADKFAQWLLETFDYNNETVMVAPAAGFYSTPGVGLNQIRIAYVLNETSLIKAVKILGEALKVYKD